MKKNNRKGFTIVELVIVIAVIAILAAVLIPTFSGVLTRANESAALQEAMAVWKEAYAVDMSDGAQDGLTGEQIADIAGEGKTFTYTASGNSYTFSMIIDGCTVTYDGTKWTVSSS